MERIENKIEKRNNKKNVQKKVLMVAGLALLLGFVGYTGGTTYAKYVTKQDTGSQVATVAKWGYTISANADDLFSDAYDKDSAHVAHGSTGVVVNADSAGTNLVAPGTNGSFNLQINGTAEVVSQLKVDVSDVSKIALTSPSVYEPVKWKVTDNNDPANTKTNLTQTEMLTELNNLDKRFEPNQECNIDLTISWEWKFHVDEATDVLDTYLGDLIGLSDSELTEKYADSAVPTGTTTLEFGVTVTVEQLAE